MYIGRMCGPERCARTGGRPGRFRRRLLSASVGLAAVCSGFPGAGVRRLGQPASGFLGRRKLVAREWGRYIPPFAGVQFHTSSHVA